MTLIEMLWFLVLIVSSSSSQADNCKNNLLMLGEGPTCVINGSFDNKLEGFSQQRKKIILVLVNQTQNFA